MADLSVFRKITSRISSVLGFLSGNAPGSHFMSAVVLAGGSGTRLGGVSKQLLELCGKKVVCYSLDAFENSEYTSEIILVVREDETDIMKDIVSSGGYRKVSKIVPGGDTRAKSAENGFFAADKRSEYVAVHDACRPLITPETVDKLWKKVLLCDACTAAEKVTDTIKTAGKMGVIESTVPRDNLYAVSTPQLFTKNIYRASVATAHRDGFESTDDCALAENAGFGVTLVDIGEPNYKITYPRDLETVEAILKKRLEDKASNGTGDAGEETKTS